MTDVGGPMANRGNDELTTPQVDVSAALSAHLQHPRPAAHNRLATRLIYIVLIMMLAVFVVLLVLMNQRTPYTSEAVLRAPVIGIAANVSGDIIEVGVRDNQLVKAGDLLFQIDPSVFETALKAANAQLDYVTQQLGAEATGLGAAEAAVVQATARLADVEQQNIRVESLFKRGVSARAAVDAARANLAVAQSNLRTAEVQLAQATERLGPQGEDNPQIQSALAQREKAQIDLMHARVTAPVDGAVTNTVLSVGQFVGSGQHVATVIDTANVWIVAQIPENALGRIKPGDRVDIVLDVAPGRVFQGKVESTGSGVEQVIAPGLQGDVPSPVNRRVWLRDVQRIPVRIDLDGLGSEIKIRSGARASVTIYTETAGFVEPVARAWMWTVAYVRFAF
ncbi:HlyD family secretion protein [Aestuariivirga sp.]|uniref:HlyD family secretion protein n=1 Tax=Aestuariivirga sp. TaxID=2650926 RepID=UPI003593CB1E